MSTHNLCFGAKIRKKVYPCIPQFCYIKVGFKGVYFSWACFPDVKFTLVLQRQPTRLKSTNKGKVNMR